MINLNKVQKNEVKVSFNNPVHCPEGYYYKGRFTMTKEVYKIINHSFIFDRNTTIKDSIIYLSRTSRTEFIDALQAACVPVKIDRAFVEGMNYYIVIK
jgi:hypothetical protein